MTEPSPGPLEASVRRDVAALGALTAGVRPTMAALAYGLAAQLDRAYVDGAAPSVIAALNKELRATLLEVTRTADDNTRRDQLTAILNAAVEQEAGVPTDVGDTP